MCVRVVLQSCGLAVAFVVVTVLVTVCMTVVGHRHGVCSRQLFQQEFQPVAALAAPSQTFYNTMSYHTMGVLPSMQPVATADHCKRSETRQGRGRAQGKDVGEGEGEGVQGQHTHTIHTIHVILAYGPYGYSAL